MTAMTNILLQISSSPTLAVLFKSTLILTAGVAAASLARQSSASVRHLILASSLLAALGLPFFAALAPQKDIAIAVAAPHTTPRYEPETAIDTPAPAAVTPATTTPQASADVPWGLLIPALWLFGFGILMLRLAHDLWRLAQMRREGLPSPHLRARVRQMADLPNRVELLLHEGISAPLTCGVIRPAVLLPTEAEQWSDRELRHAMVHELEHVRRADWPVFLLARLACALYWFHPLAWIANRRLSLEAERACDDAVVRHDDSAEYATQLVSLAKRMSAGVSSPALGMAQRSDLSARVSAVLDANQKRGRASRLAALTIWACAVLMVAAIAPVRAVAQFEQAQRLVSKIENRQLDTALFEAAERGDTGRMERLLVEGANVNAQLQGDGTPLIAAARNGHEGAVLLLLNRGADINLAVAGDGNPLIAAAQNRHLLTVRLLLERGADIHKAVRGDGNALIMAARGGSVPVVQLLLDRGANIEQVVPGDENALIEASASGHLPVVKLLVGRGANVNARVWVEEQKEWRTPLNMAQRRGRTEVVEYLRSAGARE
jgi:beta-lactamase regulating signal transducer with metallopeptidase domain